MNTVPSPELREWVATSLPQARWFAGKDRGGYVQTLRFLTEWVAGAEPIRSWAVEVAYPDGNQETYHLVVEYTVTGPREPLSDGWQRLWRSVAHGLRTARGLPEAAGTWTDAPVRMVPGEQTHTSLFVGDVAILKVYRRLDPGSDDRIRALVFPATAPVPRTYLTVGAARHPVLLTVSQQIPDAVDGWHLATQAARGDLEFGDSAAALGRALRLVHEGIHGASFHPTVPGSTIADQMTRRVEAAADDIAALLPHVQACRHVFDRLAGLQIAIQSVHGDFHLGQTLRDRQGDWWIIDFDGEPLKPVTERLAPDSPWRDVAGMLRSFDYAAQIGAASDAWRITCRDTFLRGYRAHAAELTSDEIALITAYEVDKAVYDVTYETRHRPDWVPVALAALTAVLDREGER